MKSRSYLQFFFLSALLFSAIPAFSQLGWNIKPVIPFSARGYVRTADSCYLLPGVWIDFETYKSSMSANPERAALVKWSPQKGVIWEQKYASDFLKSLNAVAVLPNGNLVAAGGSVFKAYKFVMLNPQGKLLKEFDLPYSGAVYDIEIAADGWLLSGFFEYQNQIYGIIKVNERGEIVWSLPLRQGRGSAWDDFVLRMIPFKGGYYLGATIGREIWVMAINHEGKQLWATKVDEAYSEANDFMQHSNGDLWITGKGEVHSKEPKPPGAVLVARIDTSGHLRWMKQFGNYYGDSGEAIAENPDGSVMVLARMPTARSAMLHLDVNGKLLDQKPTYTQDFFFGFHRVEGDSLSWFERTRGSYGRDEADGNFYLRQAGK